MSAAVTAPAAAVGHERLTLADRSSVRSRALALAPWLLLAVFLAAELAVCAMQLNGPFLDEGIYLAAGLRTLQGHGIGDGYLTWFSGSLMWPVIAAVGLEAARTGGRARRGGDLRDGGPGRDAQGHGQPARHAR